MKHFILPLIAGLGLIAASAEFQPEPKNQGTAFQVVPVLRADDNLRFLMPITLEGAKTHFLLDTGCAFSSVVSIELTKTLNKELGSLVEIKGFGGTSKAYEVAFGQFKLGGVYAVDFKKTLVTEMSHIRSCEIAGKPVKPEGLVGSLTLMALRGVFDTAARHVLVPPSGAPKGLYQRSIRQQGAVILPLSRKAYAYPFVTAKLKGKTYTFLIDTGATTDPFLGVADGWARVAHGNADAVASTPRASPREIIY